MLRAKLEVLGLEIPLGLFNVYHDDGFVSSISEHIERLRKKYRVSKKKPDKNSNNEILGQYTRIQFRRPFGWFGCKHHIYYVDTGNYPLNLEVRAHEETHVVDALGRLDLLADKILEEQRVKIDFEAWEKSREIRAELGGIYALFAHNMTPGMIDEIQRGGPFKIAWRIYEGSRLPERKIFS